MKKFVEEFKEFINQGNVMDLAVAVVIGSAFTAMVNSVVADLIMPLISAITGGIQFENMKLFIPLGAGESAIAYGNFINAVVQFLIIALVVFLMVKGLNKMRKLGQHDKVIEEVVVAVCPFCLQELTDGATRCHHCTSHLPEPAKSTTKAVAE